MNIWGSGLSEMCDKIVSSIAGSLNDRGKERWVGVRAFFTEKFIFRGASPNCGEESNTKRTLVIKSSRQGNLWLIAVEIEIYVEKRYVSS